MDQWTEEFGAQCFITDLGGGQEVETEQGEVSLGRYAVWAPHQKRHQIVEVGSDLEGLRRKYHIPIKRVCTLVRR